MYLSHVPSLCSGRGPLVATLLAPLKAKPFSRPQSCRLIWTQSRCCCLFPDFILSSSSSLFYFLVDVKCAWCLWLWNWVLLMTVLALSWLYLQIARAHIILAVFGLLTFPIRSRPLRHWFYQVQPKPLGQDTFGTRQKAQLIGWLTTEYSWLKRVC